jgi:hypothetical protein
MEERKFVDWKNDLAEDSGLFRIVRWYFARAEFCMQGCRLFPWFDCNEHFEVQSGAFFLWRRGFWRWPREARAHS